MQINFLVRWLPPRIDGVGDYTWNLVNALRNLAVDARLFTSKEQAPLGLAQNEWVFPIISEWKPKEVVKALKNVTGHTPDWLCLQYVPQSYSRKCIAWHIPLILDVLKKEFQCNMAVTFHEFISSWGIGIKDLFLAATTRLQTRRILSAVDLGITTCERYKSILHRLSPSPLTIAVIPVGSNIEPIFITPEKLTEVRRENLPLGAKIFGIFSRLCPARNFPLALRALKETRRQGIDARLLLLGNVESSNPKYFKQLMLLADNLGVKPYIIATGELSKEDLSVYLRMVDVFIFPQSDGISTRNTALMAALAHGLPILSFKPQPGNFNGFGFNIPCSTLIDKNDEQGFIRSSVECLSKSDNLSVAAQANRDYYYRHFSWPVIAKKYIEALGV